MTALIPFQQSSSSSSPPLLVRQAHLGRILTVLSDLTAACKILLPSLLARDNILQQLQHVWHVALQCALACDEMLLSTSSGEDLPSTSHDCCNDSNGSDAGSCAGGGGAPSSGGDSRSTSPSMSPTTNRSNNFPTRGVLENDTLEATAPSLKKTVPTTNLLGRQSAHERSESLPPCETYRRRSRRRTDGYEHDDNSDEPLLERTITGMLRTVSLAATCRGHSNEEDRDHEQREQRNKREDASAPNVPPHRSAAVASSYRASVPSSSTTMFKQQDQAEVDDEPSSSSPSSHHHEEEEAQLIDVQGNTTTSIIIIAFRRMCELIALAEAFQKKIVGAVLAQYYSIALLSCTDSILRELGEWVQQIQQHQQPLSSMTAFMKNTMPLEYNNNNNNCGSNQSGGTGGTNTANGVPFSLWMQLVVEAQPTVAATRLLCRSRDICIDGGSLEPSEALGAEGSIPPPPQEAPPPAASPLLLGSTTTPLSASSSIDSRPPRERTSSFAGDARPSAPADVMFRYIVVAVRTVAPCGHAQECLGNRQLLFVQRHHQPSPVDDEDDDNENGVQDLSSTATVHTVLAAECSVGREFHNGDSDMQGHHHHHPWSSDSIFVVSGRLIEDRLSSEDRFQSASKIGHVVMAPYSSPILTAQENDQQLLLDDNVGGGDVLLRFPAAAGTTGSAIDDDWMYAQHFPDAAPHSLEDDQHQRGGNDTEADSQNSRNVTALPLVPITVASDCGGNTTTTTTRNDSCPRPPGGLRAGDAMFMAELTSRLEFWMERGSIPRDFDEDFRRAASEELSLELDDDHSNNSTEESNVATDIVPPVDLATSRVPLHCFSTFVGHLDVHMSSHIDVSGPVNSDKANLDSDNQQRGARQEAQKKIASAQRMLSGCVLSVLDASPTATSSEREESTQHAALGLRMIATTLVSATEPPHYLEGRAAVECRKLLHKLAQQSRWRGILWNPRTGKAKATLELNRCSREEAHRSGGIARDDDEEGTSGVVNHSLYFSVSWLPYIAPMRWYIQRHCALLVDLDRTIVDNAVAISLAEAEVIRAS
ncbi:GPI-anchored surface protein, putative, partial [Bodo saltans]